MSSISPGGQNRNDILPEDFSNEEQPLGGGKKKRLFGEVSVGPQGLKVSTDPSGRSKSNAEQVASAAQAHWEDPVVLGATASAVVSSQESGCLGQELVQNLQDEGIRFLDRLCMLVDSVKELFSELEEVDFSLGIFRQNRLLEPGAPRERHPSSSSLQEQFREAANRVGNRSLLEKKEESLLSSMKEVLQSAERILSTSNDLRLALNGIPPGELQKLFPNQFSHIMHELQVLGLGYSDSLVDSNGSYGAWGLSPSRGLSKLFSQIKLASEQTVQELLSFREEGLPESYQESESTLRRLWMSVLQKMNQLYQQMLFFVFWVVRSLRRLVFGNAQIDPKIGDPQGRAHVDSISKEVSSTGRMKREDLSEEDVIQRADAGSTSAESTRRNRDGDPNTQSDSGNEADSEGEELEDENGGDESPNNMAPRLR